jgi:hypothetical protein
MFQKSRKHDPGCSSRIPDLDFFTHPGSLIQWLKRHQIPEPGSGAHRRFKLEELQNWQFLMKPQ